MRNRKVIWDREKKEIIITQEKRINTDDAANVKEVKQNLENELRNIIRQVKQLKARAEEIKNMLDEIEGAGIVNPAPVPETKEFQSSPAE